MGFISSIATADFVFRGFGCRTEELAAFLYTTVPASATRAERRGGGAKDNDALAAGVAMGCVGWETLDSGSVPSMSIGDGVDGNAVALFKGVRGESGMGDGRVGNDGVGGNGVELFKSVRGGSGRVGAGGNGVDGDVMGLCKDVEGEGRMDNSTLGGKKVDDDAVAGNGELAG